MARRKWWIAVLAGIVLVAGATVMEAQWVMAGRAAANRIRRMTQRSGSGGYDVATVLLEAPAERVYAGAVKALEARPDITITRQDSKQGRLELRKGDLVAGLEISPVSEKVTQLLVASSVGDGAQPSATPLVVEGVLRVCEEMKVECSLQTE